MQNSLPVPFVARWRNLSIFISRCLDPFPLTLSLKDFHLLQSVDSWSLCHLTLSYFLPFPYPGQEVAYPILSCSSTTPGTCFLSSEGLANEGVDNGVREALHDTKHTDGYETAREGN